MPRITKPIRVEQSYFDKIEAWAKEGKRSIGQQVEILVDTYEGSKKREETDKLLGEIKF